MSVPGAARGAVFHAVPESGVLTEGNDTLFAGALAQDVDALGGNDLLVLDYSGSPESAALHTGRYPDSGWMIGSDMVPDAVARGFERLRFTGSTWGDVMEAPTGAATLKGGAGDDYIFLRGGNNVVFGGSGDDEIGGARLTDRVRGGAGFDIMLLDLSEMASGAEIDRTVARGNWQGIEMIGGRLTGHDDTFIGGAPLKRSRYSEGSPELDAGQGDDLLVLDYSRLPDAGAIQFSAFDISTTVFRAYLRFQGGVQGNSGDFYGFERFDITATSAADEIHVLGGRGTLRAGAGDDEIHVAVAAGFDIHAGAGDDTIHLRALDDHLVRGGPGHDTLVLGLSDLFDGSRHAPVSLDLRRGAFPENWRGIEAVRGLLTEGDDSFAARDYLDSLDGGEGVDLLTLDYRGGTWRDVRFEAAENFQTGSLTTAGLLAATATEGGQRHEGRLDRFERFALTGSAGDDTLGGANRADTLKGMAGNDRLSGGGGTDRLIGGDGRDYLDGGAGDDLLAGGAGADTLYGAEGQDTLFGGQGDDGLAGGNGNDVAHGGAGNDTLAGGAGNDTVFGGAGDDTIHDGFGNDSMIGGAGADRFVFDPISGHSGRDRIADFDVAQDRLVFTEWEPGRLMRITAHEEGTRVAWSIGSVLLEGVAIETLTEANFVL